MKRTMTSELPKLTGDRVLVAGWLHRRRQLKNVVFLVIRDAHGLAQVVVRDQQTMEAVEGLQEESVLSITAFVSSNDKVSLGVELVDPTIEIISRVTEPVPLDLYRPEIKESLNLQLDAAPIALRHPTRTAVFRIAAESLKGYRNTLNSVGFTEIQSPKVVANATESGANVFALNYFGRPAYLAQSPQFYKQMMVGVFERVFEVGPVFRAEPHDTARHLSEYVSMDAEMGFIQDHRDVMTTLTSVVRGMIDAVLAAPGDLQTHFAGGTAPNLSEEVPVIYFPDAMEMIGKDLGEDLSSEPDLAPAHERWLGEWALREYNSDFIYVTGYPMAKRPFYTYPDPNDSRYSNSFDLLFRGIELVTGGQRLHSYDDYIAALAAKGQSPEPLASYLQTFRYGMPRHGGFAIGLERWTARLTGAANIRETTLFPRDLHRVTP